VQLTVTACQSGTCCPNRTQTDPSSLDGKSQVPGWRTAAQHWL
jgi:hypothetical protein